MKKNYDLGAVETGSSGMDAFFASNSAMVTPTSEVVKQAAVQPKKPMRTKVGSVQQLEPFHRLSSETLIHRSTQDLWTISKEADGQYYIERLFNDDGLPIKG